ncbi:hypothetical protein QCA50_006765 [Cerrena zonata]|uniref:DUF427 domain-containing protein n=1 Tax=Cerrena zonata TaxID=2478898 RepID=A0AAW0GJQ3_9APHY
MMSVLVTQTVLISPDINDSPQIQENSVMVKVVLNGTVLAESDQTIVVENNHYFPPSSVNNTLFSSSSTSTFCPWKGTAAYYNADVGGKTVNDIAWYYPSPKDAASNIKDHVAFYKNKVTIED